MPVFELVAVDGPGADPKDMLDNCINDKRKDKKFYVKSVYSSAVVPASPARRVRKRPVWARIASRRG